MANSVRLCDCQRRRKMLSFWLISFWDWSRRILLKFAALSWKAMVKLRCQRCACWRIFWEDASIGPLGGITEDSVRTQWGPTERTHWKDPLKGCPANAPAERRVNALQKMPNDAVGTARGVLMRFGRQSEGDTHSQVLRSNLNLIKSLLINVRLIEIKVCCGMRADLFSALPFIAASGGHRAIRRFFFANPDRNYRFCLKKFQFLRILRPFNRQLWVII